MALAALAPRPAAAPQAAIDPRRLFAPFAAGAGGAAAAFWPDLMREGDTWWHLSAGDWVLANRAAPHVDPFSFSFLGQPWVAHEWLSEAFMALSFRAGGWAGLALLFALAFGATLGVLARRLQRSMDDGAGALVLVTVATLLAPSLTARPHMLAMPLIALWADRLLAAREAQRAPSLWLALVMMLWANLHGGFLFGLALIGPFALEALVEAPEKARGAAFLAWARFGALSLLAALATPFGVEGLLFPFKLMRLETLSLIGEWQAPNLAAPGLLPTVLLGMLALAMTASARLGAIRTLTLAGLCALTIAHARHETLLAIVGAMLLAPSLGALAARFTPKPEAAADPLWPVLAPMALVIVAARLLHPIARAEDGVSPMAALAAVPSALRAGPVLNDYNFGGYLIFSGVRPYVDGRTDLYGDAFLRDFANLPHTPGALRAELERDHIGWTIFKPDRAIVGALDKEPGWRRLFANDMAVVHVRAGN